MPFGIPSEDFHGGFGLPSDDDYVEEYKTHTTECRDDATEADYDFVGKENQQLKDMLLEVKSALFYMLMLHKAHTAGGRDNTKLLLAMYSLQSGEDAWSVERAEKVFHKLYDYFEKE